MNEIKSELRTVYILLIACVITMILLFVIIVKNQNHELGLVTDTLNGHEDAIVDNKIFTLENIDTLPSCGSNKVKLAPYTLGRESKVTLYAYSCRK